MPLLDEQNAYEKFVQSGMRSGEYLNAAYTLIAAGPPRLAMVAGGTDSTNTSTVGSVLSGCGANMFAYPVGLLQNFNLSWNRNIMRIWEIGSERSYFISGRTIGSLGLGRVYYHGPSILRVLYAYYADRIPPVSFGPLFNNIGMSRMENPHDVKIPPGYENFFINLASDLFAQPVGLLLYVKDTNGNALGAIYFEDCYVPSHNIATDSQGTLYNESVAIQFERGIPIKISGMKLRDQAYARDIDALKIGAGYPPIGAVA